MKEKLSLYGGILIMSIAGGLIGKKLDMAVEMGCFALGLLLVSQSDFFNVVKRLESLEKKEAKRLESLENKETP
jgi:hypothetical protein